jgi:hypothetical protein
VKNCQFNKFTEGGISVNEGSSLTMEGGELQENTVGIEARDAGTQVQVSNVSFIGNDLLGIVAYEKAEVTARGCTFQDNGYCGVQSGLPGKPDMATTVNLVDCKLYNSRTMDARACDQSKLVLKNCTFAPGAAPQLVRDPTGVVEADPPIQVLASGNKGQPPQPIPANKGTASNSTGGKPPAPRKSYQPPQQQRPAPSKQPNSLPGKVGEVIDAIDKVKRLIR